mgnify:CR=1 FL=1
MADIPSWVPMAGIDDLGDEEMDDDFDTQVEIILRAFKKLDTNGKLGVVGAIMEGAYGIPFDEFAAWLKTRPEAKLASKVTGSANA